MMVESTPDRHRGESVVNTHGSSAPPGISRHDLVLAVIPTVFLAALLVGQLLSVPLEAAMLAASIIAALTVADALFLNPPGRDVARR